MQEEQSVNTFSIREVHHTTHRSFHYRRLVEDEQPSRAFAAKELSKLLQHCVHADELLHGLRAQLGREGLQDLARAPAVALCEGHAG